MAKKELEVPASTAPAEGPRVLTGDEVRDLLKQLGWKQTTLAGKTGFAPNTVWRWISGDLEAPVWLGEYLQALLAVRQLALHLGVAK